MRTSLAVSQTAPSGDAAAWLAAAARCVTHCTGSAVAAPSIGCMPAAGSQTPSQRTPDSSPAHHALPAATACRPTTVGEPQLINLYSYVTLTTPVVWSVGTTGRVVGRFEHMLDRYTNWIRDSSLLTAMAVGEGLLGSGGGEARGDPGGQSMLGLVTATVVGDSMLHANRHATPGRGHDKRMTSGGQD